MSAAPSTWGAVIVAAGRGERFGRPKQLLDVAGLPLAGWSIHTFAGMPEVAELIVVTEGAVDRADARVARSSRAGARARVVAGGATRRESAFNGMRALTPTLRCDLDPRRRASAGSGRRRACRHEPGAVRRTRRAARRSRRRYRESRRAQSRTVVETLDRERLWAAQTPQMATAADLRRAHELAARDGAVATDDAVLLERAGIEVVVVRRQAKTSR